MAALLFVAVAGICGWLFVYTGDLPDIEHLSQFAPSAQSPVFDSCLASSSTAIPFNRIGKPMRDALTAAESPTSLPHQGHQSFMDNLDKYPRYLRTISKSRFMT
jgi:hypothetical protein